MPFFALILSAALSDTLGAALANRVASQHVPGAAVGVVRDGKLVFVQGFGLRNVAKNEAVDADTQFEIGSVTKQFTAAAILQLQEQGKLSIDDLLSKYLPAFPHAGEITLRQLLNQTTGLPNFTEAKGFMKLTASHPGTLAAVADLVKGPLHFKPGSDWEYSNTNYYVLGGVIEAVSGISYPAYVREHLFAPAGMTHSGFGDDEAGIADFATPYWRGESMNGPLEPAPVGFSKGWGGGAGSIVSSVGDLAAWDTALASGRIVSDADYKLMSTPVSIGGHSDGYGMGISIGTFDGHAMLSHHGGTAGTQSLNAVFPADHLAIIVYINALNGEPDSVANAAFETLVPEAATAAHAPAPGEDLGARPRIIRLLDETLHARLQQSELDPEFAKIATPESQKQMAADFASLGAPTAIIFKGKKDTGDGPAYRYRVEFAASAITFTVMIDTKTNLVGGIGIGPPE